MVKPSRPEVFFGCAAVACVVASVAVFLWKKWPDPGTFGTKGEWVGALATLAAALTAVAIAFWSQRRGKIDSMVDGAFEIVAADYLIGQLKARAELFRLQLTKYVELVTELKNLVSRCEQQIEAAQKDVNAPMDLIVGLESHYKSLTYRQNEESAKAISNFSGHVEYLQSQIATLSHQKMAGFDPAAGLAVVKVKALLRRIEGLIQLGATDPALLQGVTDIIVLLQRVQVGVTTAERHIKNLGENH